MAFVPGEVITLLLALAAMCACLAALPARHRGWAIAGAAFSGVVIILVMVATVST